MAASGITTANTTTITNGYYGSSPTATTTGTFTPLGTPSGLNSANAGTAQTQLTTLVNNIASVVSGLPSVALNTTYGIVTLTIAPNRNNSAAGIAFTGTTITFDGQNLVNPQFFITSTSAGAITFTNVTINLINGATSNNIFLVSAAGITTTTPSSNIYGIFIAQSSITFASASTIQGALYAQTASISFSGTTSVTNTANIPNITPVTPVTPISNICFPANTRIDTDQGAMPIQDIDTEIHTIGGQSIIEITRTVSTDDFLVSFEPDALGKGVPSERTVMSREHKVLYRGAMIEAHCLLGAGLPGVGVVAYQRETLYNVLLDGEHGVMGVQGMIC